MAFSLDASTHLYGGTSVRQLVRPLVQESVHIRAGGTRSGRGRERAIMTLLTGRGRGRVDAFENADADAVDSIASSRVLAVMLFL